MTSILPASDDRDEPAVEADVARHTSKVATSAKRQIQEWAKKLVDLSRRNRLLYYRPTKRTTLTFIRPEPDRILSRLIDGGHFTFYEPPPLPPYIPGRPRDITPLQEEVARRRPLEREVVTDQRDPAEIAKSLDAINRKARAEFEDRGTHVLYLAWGMLHWSDPKINEPVRAPIVMLPLELTRASVTQPYQLRAAPDGDATINAALRVKLEVDFQIDLPDADVDELTPAQVLDLVRGAVPRTWSVEPHASIGIFGFAKEAMYRDLVDHAQVVAKHPVIRSMVKGGVTDDLEKSIEVDVPKETELDLLSEPGYSVIDADSSQRRAIEAANSGQSFVLHGPPGTGKSQTITNIIAEFIGRGRSVLFVSQKMAALEVVAKRLQEAGLGELVLELHSAKASRGEVAGALARALDAFPHVDESQVTRNFKSVQQSRQSLNEYAGALHKQREPLQRSAFDVLAELASLADAPAIETPAVDASAATATDLGDLVRSVQRLQDAWRPVEEGDAFPWWSIAAPVGTAAERDQVRALLMAVRDTVTALERLDGELGPACEWPAPHDQEERRRRAAFASVVAARVDAPLEWLTSDDLSPYSGLLERWEQHSADRAGLIASLETAVGARWRELDPQTSHQLRAELATLTELLGGIPDWDRLVGDTAALVAVVERLDAEIADATARGATLAIALGVPAGNCQAELHNAIEIARISQSRNRPRSTWLSRARLAEAEAFAGAHGDAYLQQQRASSDLFEQYEEGLLALDLDPLTERMRRWHGHWWNRLRPQHRADRAAIVAVTRMRQLLPSVLEDLAAALDLRASRAALGTLDGRAHDVLGPYANGLDTNMAAVSEALSSASRLLELTPAGTDWERLGSVSTADTAYNPEVERLADALEGSLRVVQESLRQLGIHASAQRQAELLDWHLEQTPGWAKGLATELSVLARLHGGAITNGAASGITTLLQQADARSRIDEIERDLGAHEPILRAGLRTYYAGFATDWAAMRHAVDWAQQTRARYGSQLPEPVAKRLLNGELDELPWSEHLTAVERLDSTIDAARAIFGEAHQDAVAAEMAGAGPDARAWLDERLLRIDDLETWHALNTARADLDHLGWSGFTDQLIARRTARENLVPAVRRGWLEAWFRSLAAADASLDGFSRAEHERIVASFRAADMKQVAHGRDRVLAAYGKRKPQPATVQGGEQAVVRREALKKRRHLPVRALLASLPTVLPKIKPCLMMSPLSVSHFLTPDMVFDLVVFDEASQVPPEDAVNCIYRGRQLVVAGDPKQLPPTDFFQLSAVSEQDGEFEEDIGDFDSVLELCQGIGLPPQPLLWHYRSRHDALIAFSNHYIYDGSLVTFPAPYERTDDLGLTFVHVPNAVFERGGSASNPEEARKVVDVVVDHWHRNPTDSIGVVAFSVAQQDAVLDELERRIQRDPTLERHMGSGRLDQFFVKNLETVQGDERDVIVFTIGYGRDDQGRIYNNFGALNRAGGARRLNVAVTRARRRVIVVSSIRASDLQLPEAKAQRGVLPNGAELLRSYLEYAEHGTLPERMLAANHDGLGPLEEDVAGFIASLGYDTVRRVGTSDYRVDLGVVSRVAPGRLALGVECDGEMYLRAATARDRDRLREQVLQGLGWSTHRVWAPAWYFHRHEEMERLRHAIEHAEQSAAEGSQPITSVEPGGEDALPRKPVWIERKEVRLDGPEDAVALGWAEPFAPSKVLPYRNRWDFSDPSMLRAHADRIAALVVAEGPLHERYIATRLARAYGLHHAGSRMFDAVVGAISMASVLRKGAFVWPPKSDLSKVRVPIAGKDDTMRAIDHIPPEELALAMLRVVETAGSIDQGQARVAVARILGFERTGDKIDQALEVRQQALLKAKRLTMSGGVLELGPKADLPRMQRVTGGDPYPVGTWIRHHRFGNGEVIAAKGFVLTIQFADQESMIDASVVQLVKIPKPR